MHEAPDSPTTAPVYDPTFDERDELIGSLGIGDPVRTQLLNDPFLTLEYLRGKVPQMLADGKTKGLAVIIFRQHEPLTPSEVRASLYGDTHTEESQAQGGALSIFDQNHREPGNARLYREREHAAQPFVGGAFRDVVD